MAPANERYSVPAVLVVVMADPLIRLREPQECRARLIAGHHRLPNFSVVRMQRFRIISANWATAAASRGAAGCANYSRNPEMKPPVATWKLWRVFLCLSRMFCFTAHDLVVDRLAQHGLVGQGPPAAVVADDGAQRPGWRSLRLC